MIRRARGEGEHMRTMRRSLHRAWRVMTWPLSGHIALALGTGLAFGITDAHYPASVPSSSTRRWSRCGGASIDLGGAVDDERTFADAGCCCGNPLVAADDAGTGAGRRRRRARLYPLPRILRRQYPQPAHAAGLLPRRRGIPHLV